jgi:translation initiation factor RLI1
MSPDERQVLERAIRRVTEQAENADSIVDEAMAAGLDGSDKIVVSTKMPSSRAAVGEGRSRTRT